MQNLMEGELKEHLVEKIRNYLDSLEGETQIERIIRRIN